MSETSKNQQEPTMEEILASIRRIISEDGDGAKPAAPAGAPAAAPAAAPPPPPAAAPLTPKAEAAKPEPSPLLDDDDDVFELTQMVKDDGSVVDLAAKPNVPPPPPIPEPPAMPPASAMSAPPPPTPSMTEPLPMNDDDQNLLSAPSAQATTNALADLAGAVTAARGMPVGAGQRTLEDIVKELLRPMLRQWLDANLPSLVNRIVEREVAKLAGRVDDTLPR